MAGPTGEVKGGPPNPAEKWLTSKSWNEAERSEVKRGSDFKLGEGINTKKHVWFPNKCFQGIFLGRWGFNGV